MMKTGTVVIATMLAWIFAAPLQAHESEQKLDMPGFRPITEYAAAAAFAQNVKSAKIAVFPSMVRTVHPAEQQVTQEYSKAAQEQIVKFLGENSLGTAHAETAEFDMTEEAENKGQFSLFMGGIQSIGKQLSTFEGDADYILMIDIIFVKTSVWGIQCYILDREGTNVFSFLFNSHHKAFVDAKLQTSDESPESRQRLIAESTTLALTALKKQVVLEQEIASYKPEPRHAGRYVDRDAPSDYVEYRPDGSFVGMEGGHVLTGTYAVVHSNIVVLTILDTRTHSKVHVPVGELKEGTLYSLDGEILEKTETATPKAEFNSWIKSRDSNDDGMISREEFVAGAKKLKAREGKTYDPEKVAKYFAQLDKNKDGFITPNEEPQP